MQVTADLVDDFRDGVFFVQLGLSPTRPWSTRRSPSRSAFENRTRSPYTSLMEHLPERQLLVILDNFEHVVSAAPVVSALLAFCPELKVLVGHLARR
jgi:hypothetical protein